MYAWLRRHPVLIDGALPVSLLAIGANVFTSFLSS
jgi:hypothetical protein